LSFSSSGAAEVVAEAPQSVNPYSYGYNGPLAYPDPYGECPICVAALPVIGRAAVAVGRVVAVDAATNAVISAGGYYLNHRADKGEIDWADFRRTVGEETFDQTLSDLKPPVTLILSAVKVGAVADLGMDSRSPFTLLNGASKLAVREEWYLLDGRGFRG
jgi:hypothetical protein